MPPAAAASGPAASFDLAAAAQAVGGHPALVLHPHVPPAAAGHLAVPALAPLGQPVAAAATLPSVLEAAAAGLPPAPAMLVSAPAAPTNLLGSLQHAHAVQVRARACQPRLPACERLLISWVWPRPSPG